MALAMDYGGKVVSIDNYRRPDINNLELVRQNLYDCGISDRVELIKGDTLSCGNHMLDAKPEVVFMDASHKAENLHKEYLSMKRWLLPEEHVLVIDDALFNDIADFVKDLMKDEGYPFCFFVPFHQGMAVLAKSSRHGDQIWLAIKQVEERN